MDTAKDDLAQAIVSVADWMKANGVKSNGEVRTATERKQHGVIRRTLLD